MDNRELLGQWRTDPADSTAIRQYGHTTMVFGEDGRLTYIIHGEAKDEVMEMRYRVDESTLVTNQPSHQREDRTPFTITQHGTLVLDYGRVKAHYIRADK